MSVLEVAAERARPWLARLTQCQWIPQLLVRLFIGYFFFETGWAKAGNLAGMAERFTGWGIPFPAFNAALSAYTEMVGGALIVLGLATRLAAIPLGINMVVAILVVNIKTVTGLDEFVELAEPLYALTFLWLFFSGPGWVSLDHLIFRRLARPDGAAGPAMRATRARR
jgi:putative oxidoreductase